MTPMRLSNCSSITRNPLYASLSRRAVCELAQASLEKVVEKDAILFQQGDTPQFLHIVLSGQVCLKITGRRARQTVLEVLSAGDILDVPMFVLSIPYMYTAVTTIRSRVMMVPSTACRRVLSEEPSWADALLSIVSRYLCDFVRQTIELKLDNIDERTASYLLSKARGSGKTASFTLSESHLIAAQRLGMTPESFSRALRRLRKLGLDSRGKNISITDTDRLKEYYGVVDAKCAR